MLSLCTSLFLFSLSLSRSFICFYCRNMANALSRIPLLDELLRDALWGDTELLFLRNRFSRLEWNIRSLLVFFIDGLSVVADADTAPGPLRRSLPLRFGRRFSFSSLPSSSSFCLCSPSLTSSSVRSFFLDEDRFVRFWETSFSVGPNDSAMVMAATASICPIMRAYIVDGLLSCW